MAFDKETVRRVAHLARIKASEAELDRYAAECAQILGWIEQLNEVDTDDVPPMTRVVDMKLPWRKDAVTDGDCAEDVLANAPDPAAGGFYTVPKVVE